MAPARARCKTDVVAVAVPVAATAIAVASVFEVAAPAISFLQSSFVLNTFGSAVVVVVVVVVVAAVVESTLPRHGESGLTPRLHASKL